MEPNFSSGPEVAGQGAMILNWKRKDLIRCKEENFYYKGDQPLEQIAHRNCGCPMPGSIQSQAGWGFEKSVLAKDS